MKDEKVPYGLVRNAQDLGKVTRAHRKSRSISLETLGGLGNLGKRFLSEFERGKETAEIGKIFKALNTLGLEVTIQPRVAQSNADSSTIAENLSGSVNLKKVSDSQHE